MERLPQNKLYGLSQLIFPLGHNLILTSIIEGKTKATVYVDSIHNPKTSILWVKRKMFLLGHPDRKSLKKISSTIEANYFQYLSVHQLNSFILFFDERWRPLIRNIFPELDIEEYTRSYYNLKIDSLKKISTFLENVHVKIITNTLLSSNIKNLELVKEEMCSERNSVEDFMQHSFGHVVIKGDEIISWCMSEYNTGSKCELGIATVEDQRKKGYATLVANTVINHASEHGINEIGWHCWKNNIPSIKTAMKLGFEHIRDYKIQNVRV
jgi:hypothetical protein